MAWDWDKLQQQKKAKSGGGGGREGETPPSLDEVFGKIKNLKGKFGGSWIIILIILIAILGYNMIYKIDPDEVGVIQRFGKHVRTTYPGLHFKWPRGTCPENSKRRVWVSYDRSRCPHPVCLRVGLSQRISDADRGSQCGRGSLGGAV